MTPILEVRNVSKAFGGSRALDDVTFAVAKGEVHALMGENGAGKSTLVKIIAALMRPDGGEVLFRGRGVAVIHQELMPFPDLTVAENICIGREPVRALGWLDRAAMRRRSQVLLDRLGVPIHPDRRMGDLSVAQMQMVEIARALGRNAELLILDEPTSALSDHEVENLLALIPSLNVTVIYISHRLSEVFRIADAVTVLRDGRHVVTERAATLTEERLISLMVGRKIPQTHSTSQPGAPVLASEHLTVSAGEILGIAGLMGSGRSELLWRLFAGPSTITINSRNVRIRKPADAIANGIVLVTEDRRAAGIVPDMSVEHNITLAALDRFTRGPFLDFAAEGEACHEQIRALDIKTASPRHPIKQLSGGNQQKAVIARALLADPKVILLDEPTRGIDIGAKSEIYTILRGLAEQGKAIVMVSSELPELLSLTHRILVMRDHAITAELATAQASEEEILRHAMPN